MYPTLQGSNHKLLLVDRTIPRYLPASHIPSEYLRLVIPYAGLYYEEDRDFEMLSQHIHLGPFSVWLHDIYAINDIVLCPYAPFHLWALHFMFEDSLRTDGFISQSFMLEEKQCNLFNLYEEMHHVNMQASQKVLSFHINILPEAIQRMSRFFPSLSSLTNKRVQQISGVVNEQPYYVNAVCNMLIQHILSCRYVEMGAGVFLYRCCLDLFLNFAQQDTNEPPLLFGTPNTALFQQIFAYLVENSHRPHYVSTLADMFNIPAVKLAQGFRQHFSIGITPFIQMVRMMFVYHRLMQRGTSFETTAMETGYKSAAEMLNEVQGYYNCNMIELRRAM